MLNRRSRTHRQAERFALVFASLVLFGCATTPEPPLVQSCSPDRSFRSTVLIRGVAIATANVAAACDRLGASERKNRVPILLLIAHGTGYPEALAEAEQLHKRLGPEALMVAVDVRARQISVDIPKQARYTLSRDRLNDAQKDIIQQFFGGEAEMGLKVAADYAVLIAENQMRYSHRELARRAGGNPVLNVLNIFLLELLLRALLGAR